MDWQQFIQGFTEVIKALGEHGTPIVVTALVLVGAIAFAIVGYRGIVSFVGWARGHADRWIEKKEVREERNTSALETLAETSKAQKEILVLMDRDCKEQHAETHRRLDEQGSALARVIGHIFGGEEERG